MSKVIRVDDDIYDALMDLQYRGDSMNDVIGKMLARLGIEPFDEEFDRNE